MRKTEIEEAIERLEELRETIYDAMDEIREILREVAPDECEMAERYWLAQIDEVLGNRGSRLGRSYIDTIEALEEMMEMEEEEED